MSDQMQVLEEKQKACLINTYMCLCHQHWKRIWSQLGKNETEVVAASLKPCPQKAGDARVVSQSCGCGLKFAALTSRGFPFHGHASLMRLLRASLDMFAHFRRNYKLEP